MKVQCLTLLALFASANAFAPLALNTAQRGPVTFLEATASEEAVKEAMAASEKFGKASKEARAAWDIVEEIDASTR